MEQRQVPVLDDLPDILVDFAASLLVTLKKSEQVGDGDVEEKNIYSGKKIQGEITVPVCRCSIYSLVL